MTEKKTAVPADTLPFEVMLEIETDGLARASIGTNKNRITIFLINSIYTKITIPGKSRAN
jgi:hypothetical protein